MPTGYANKKTGAPQKSCHNTFADALNNVFQVTMPNRVDDKGIFKTWTHITKDEGMWIFLISKYVESFRQGEKVAVKICDSDPKHRIFCGILTAFSTKTRNAFARFKQQDLRFDKSNYVV